MYPDETDVPHAYINFEGLCKAHFYEPRVVEIKELRRVYLWKLR